MSRIKGIEARTQKDAPPTTRKNGNSEVKKDEDLSKEEAESKLLLLQLLFNTWMECFPVKVASHF